MLSSRTPTLSLAPRLLSHNATDRNSETSLRIQVFGGSRGRRCVRTWGPCLVSEVTLGRGSPPRGRSSPSAKNWESPPHGGCEPAKETQAAAGDSESHVPRDGTCPPKGGQTGCRCGGRGAALSVRRGLYRDGSLGTPLTHTRSQRCPWASP